MSKFGLFIVALLFYCQPADAVSPTWKVNPKVCLIKSLSETCNMLLQIALSDLPSGKYCLYQNDRKLRCFEVDDTYFEQTVSYNDNALLSLRDQSGKALLSQQLTVKARQNQTVKRRVRQPWSLF